MLEHKTGVRCQECEAPMPCATPPLGGCICDSCLDAILEEQLVRIEDEPCGQQFPDEVPSGARQQQGSTTPTEARLERLTSSLRPPF